MWNVSLNGLVRWVSTSNRSQDPLILKLKKDHTLQRNVILSIGAS